jgi:dienelactone hydrolase
MERERPPGVPPVFEDPLRIPVGEVSVEGSLQIPAGAEGMVLFAHGSGSSRWSPRNRHVAERLRAAGLGTLLVDLLTPFEDADLDARFDIDLLAARLERITAWFRGTAPGASLRVGYFGASTGAAAALRAAAALGPEIGAVVCRGGRPDLAEDVLDRVQAPTLLIVGSEDHPVLEWNREAYERLRARKELAVLPGATHLFEEPGALDEVARRAAEWFRRFLPPAAAGGEAAA